MDCIEGSNCGTCGKHIQNTADWGSPWMPAECACCRMDRLIREGEKRAVEAYKKSYGPY